MREYVILKAAIKSQCYKNDFSGKVYRYFSSSFAAFFFFFLILISCVRSRTFVLVA